MRPARPDPVKLLDFFHTLPKAVQEELQGPGSAVYNLILYNVRTPYQHEDVERALRFVGVDPTAAAMHGAAVGRKWEDVPYPGLAAAQAGNDNPRAWSAVVHFHDPSYPLYSEEAHRALEDLGYRIPSRGAYRAYVAAVDDVKEGAPAEAVPETNWFLARLIQVGLEAWGRRGAHSAKPQVQTGPSMNDLPNEAFDGEEC